MEPTRMIDEWYLDRIIQAIVPQAARLGVFIEQDRKNNFITEEQAAELRQAKFYLDKALGMLGGSRILYEAEAKAKEIEAIFNGTDEPAV